MELILSTQGLRDELRAFGSLVDRSNTLMELSNLLIETAHEKIFITGTDGDVALRTELSAEHFEEVEAGAVCVKADKLTDVLATLDSNVKSIRLKDEPNGWTTLKFGAGKKTANFRISGIMANLYPNITVARKPDTPFVSFPAGLLLQFLSSTNQAISSQDSKYLLTGANLTVGEKATMVATDGFRIARIESSLPGKFQAVFPKKVISVLSKLLAEVSPEALIEISEEPNNIFATIGNKSFSFRKLTGTFPDVSKTLNVVNDHIALFSLYDLRSAVRRADIFADKNNQSSLTLTLKPGEMEIYSKSFEEGSGTEFIDAQYDGPEIKFRVKSSFLVDFFNSVNSEGAGVTLSVAFSAEDKKPTIWKVHREPGVELGYDYECLVTKLR